MKKNLEQTPRSQIVVALRRLSLRSRERSFAIKRDKYTCQKCGVKQSKAKGKEVKKAIHEKAILLNKKIVVDEKKGATLYDTVTIVPSKKSYKMVLAENGKFKMEEVKDADSSKKVSKVIS